MTEVERMRALLAEAPPLPWAFEERDGWICRRPDPLTCYVIAEVQTSNEAAGPLITIAVNSLPGLLDRIEAAEIDLELSRKARLYVETEHRADVFVLEDENLAIKAENARLKSVLKGAVDVFAWLAENAPDCYGWEAPHPSTKPSIALEAEKIRQALSPEPVHSGGDSPGA